MRIAAKTGALQIVYAGKAHPQDEQGKKLIQEIIRAGRSLQPEIKLVYLENYDWELARLLIPGVDVWLNTPEQPLEASGTSGMKAAINGAPHLSIGDGWWAEGFNGGNGWLIDGGVTSDDTNAVDAADADALYRLLETEVVPAFYERDEANIPRRWMGLVKEAIRTVAPQFCARRMVKEYVEKMYTPALERKAVTRS
jgi:starch phosphorylase